MEKKISGNTQIANDDELLEYIQSDYYDCEPIFAENIEPIYKNAENALNRLVQRKELIKEYGAYFYGDCFGAGDVIRSYYLGRKDNIIGYFVNMTIANKLGLTTQMPFIQEIATNRMLDETGDTKKLYAGKYGCILYKPRTLVTAENAATLQLLDILNQYREYTDYSKKRNKEVFSKIHSG